MIGFEAENWDVTLNARNLFDKKHVTTCLARGDCFYGERRTVALKLTSKF
jgi:iron complex outermembrane recepter protein